MSPSERTLPPRPELTRSLGGAIRYHVLRWLPLVGAALVGYVLFPPPAGVVTNLPVVGQPAGQTVVAPFSFETPKSAEEITSEGESRALSVRPVYRYSRHRVRLRPRQGALVLRRAGAGRAAGTRSASARSRLPGWR